MSCVPLLGSSSLSPQTIPIVSRLLSDILNTLRESISSGYDLTPSIISYVFFPISTLLRRNVISAIPDQVLEKIFRVLATLSEVWWWDLDEATWEQLFMLCGSILGGIESKGKGRERDNETKEAAAACLWALLHTRAPLGDPLGLQGPLTRATLTLDRFKKHVQAEKFTPVLGQTINSLLLTAESSHRPLQRRSLEVLCALVRDYVADGFAPSILPGVVSTMCKVSLGVGTTRGWANGDIVQLSLQVLQEIIIRSISDEICFQEGVVKDIRDLEDLTELFTDPALDTLKTSNSTRFETARTPAWLQGTTSQLHIALNSLNSLALHHTPSALQALANFSAEIVAATTHTLPQSRPLLISYLLSVASSDVESVSKTAKHHLNHLLNPSSNVRHETLQSLMQIFKDNLSSLPRLLQMMAGSKVEHAALIIDAICDLGVAPDIPNPIDENVISAGVGMLLGPNGGIERWGWRLLSVLEFAPPQTMVSGTSTAQLMLEGGSQTLDDVHFPELNFKHAPSPSTYHSLERMFHSLGRVAREECLFSVEWFLGVGRRNKSDRAIAALWCAGRILEGAGDISLVGVGDEPARYRSKLLERFARGLTQTIAESWDQESETLASQAAQQPQNPDEEHTLTVVEHVSGHSPVRFKLGISSEPISQSPSLGIQPLLHKAVSLQLLAISSGIMQARFSPLLLHALYPILHSLITPTTHLSASALATLQYISNATSYATPANMLLSNFDYALDAVSRRLSRRWLDVDATHVLTLLVRLVGRDVVQRAGDVVEECFDRLDEYHGYEVVVDGLIAVLAEVVGAVASDVEGNVKPTHYSPPDRGFTSRLDSERFNSFLKWLPVRHLKPDVEDVEDVGPVPQEAWGKKDQGQAMHADQRAEDPLEEPPPTPTQELTKQIVARSMYFLTHSSSLIRSQILMLLGSAASVLPESAILPSIHQAWPFILNRFSDPEPFVISAAAQLVESLATHVGDFMSRRIWEDIWPRFRTMLAKLHTADSFSALARRGPGTVGTESAYTHSHRLYRAILKTMLAAVKGVRIQDSTLWELIVAFRRFLHDEAHEELQACARDLFSAIAQNNEDAVWFALNATGDEVGGWTFLEESHWDISKNISLILP